MTGGVPYGKLLEEGKGTCSGLSDRPRVGCRLLWWPWECLPMGPAEPDVEENELLRQWNAQCTETGLQQEDLPSEKE